LGESGENHNDWFRDVVREAESRNVGWSWWPWKKFESTAGTVTFPRTPGYQAILDYWVQKGPRPSANDAARALIELAQQTRIENCVLHPDVFDALARPDTQGQTVPFANHQVPGLIFAAHYDMGRQGEAYSDGSLDAWADHNRGYSYRNDFVDIEACTDVQPSVGFNVAYLTSGEWLKYTLDVQHDGWYRVRARVAADNNAVIGDLALSLDGASLGTVDVTSTLGWQEWATRIVASRVFIAAGDRRVLRADVVAGGDFNVHWIDFSLLEPWNGPAIAGCRLMPDRRSVAVTWNTLPGRSYHLESRTDLVFGGWETIGPSTVAAGWTLGRTNLLGSEPGRFYRVVETP